MPEEPEKEELNEPLFKSGEEEKVPEEPESLNEKEKVPEESVNEEEKVPEESVNEEEKVPEEEESVNEEEKVPEEQEPINEEEKVPEEQEPVYKEEKVPVENSNTLELQSNSQTKKLNVVNALDTLVDYITDEVAKKVNFNVNEENIQDGFNSVNKAAETMASSGGAGKKNKTRRFKLTGINKK